MPSPRISFKIWDRGCVWGGGGGGGGGQCILVVGGKGYIVYVVHGPLKEGKVA